MRKTIATIVALGLCLPFAWAGNLIGVNRLNNWLTLEQIRDIVNRDLPHGIPLAKVERYFTENNVKYTYYPKTNQVFALINNIKGGQLFVTKGAQIIVNLSSERMLNGIDVKAVFTGP
jgi:hypothetical protein